MTLSEALQEKLAIKTVFTFEAAGHTIPVTETVVVTWAIMAVLILAAVVFTRRLKTVPAGAQVFVEAGVGFLNDFAKKQFGKRAGVFAPFIGTIFLFLLAANVIPVLTPVGIFGREPPFRVAPPTRDINVTAAFALTSILVVLFSGLAVRGPAGWVKNLVHPIPMMLPFNLLEYLIRPLSLCLRLYGNILGGYIIMAIIEHVAPLIVPMPLSLYFDFFDGFIQALVFTFLTTLFIAEAVEVD